MAAARVADPELIGSPMVSLTRIPHLHLCAAALTADVEAGVIHGRDSITWRP